MSIGLKVKKDSEMHSSKFADKRKALVVGCDYVGCGENELFGCCKDARKIVDLLISRGYKKDNIRLLVDRPRKWGKDQVPAERPTKDKIMESLYWLLDDSSTRTSKLDADSVLYNVFASFSSANLDFSGVTGKQNPGNANRFFSFSGHGSYIEDLSGDEADGRDECLLAVPPLTVRKPEDDESMVVVAPLDESCYIVDDEIKEALSHSMLRYKRLMMLVDACHSGTVSDLPSGEDNKKDVRRFGDKIKEIEGSDSYVVCISGCRDDGVSLETQTGGVLTTAFLKSVCTFSDCHFTRIEHLFSKIESEVLKESDQKPQIAYSNSLCPEHRIHEFL